MRMGRVLMIGLDGYELSLAERMMSEGLLPNMRSLRKRSARFLLDHGRDKYSGLAWEHVSTGKAPEAAGRWSAVSFDPSSYGLTQAPTAMAPFFADLSVRTVFFDMPYCDLARAPRARGLTQWGAHDPGVARASRPEGLHDEIASRFGPYPAASHIYGFFWQSADRTRVAADALEQAVRVRSKAARWLLAERTPDWDLGIVVVSEAHSAIESMWHGVDTGHPLHGLPSAAVAGDGVRRIYGAIDDLVGELASAFPDATLILFSMHGMGANDADVAGMVLLGELLYRHNFGRPCMRDIEWHAHTAQGVPLLTSEQDWHAALALAVPVPASMAPCNLDWMPVARYRHHWPGMAAFALPAYYDGRVRINLQGREARGVVPLERYQAVRDEVVALLRECRDPLRGESVVDQVDFPDKHPSAIGPTEADLTIIWRNAPLGLVHPGLGRIGPIPYRRTGGHTGACGFAHIAGENVAAGDHGIGSSFDVVPTIIDLLNELPRLPLSGQSLISRFPAAATRTVSALRV